MPKSLPCHPREEKLLSNIPELNATLCMLRQEFQQESMLNVLHYDLIVKNLRATRKIPADSSCAKGKEKLYFVNE